MPLKNLEITKKDKKMKKILLMMIGLLIGNYVVAQPYTIASDDASTYSGWSNGDNGGFGFTNWELTTTTDGGFAGHFIGSAAVAKYGDIDVSGNSFGMYGNPNSGNPSSPNQSNAYRYVNNTGSPLNSGKGYLLVGQKLSFKVAINYRDGYKGFDLLDNTGGFLWNFNVASDKYLVTVVGDATDLGWAYKDSSIFVVTVEQTAENSYVVTLVRETDKTDTHVSATRTGKISGFKLYVGNTSAVNESNLFSNSFSVTTPSYQSLITGSEGWRLLSSPVTGATFSDLLGDFWTQGIATGAKTTNGSANVKTYNGTSFVDVTDLNSTLANGAGFAAYIYSDDDFDGNAEGFPKTISITGTENSGPVAVTLSSTNADAWTLAGNPYASTIDADLLTKTGLTGVVYVYDHGYTAGASPDETNSTGGAYRAWNGSAGGLTDGLIAPFQGFWVRNDSSGSPSLSIATSAKSSGGTLYKTAPKSVLTLSAEMGSLKNTAYFSFSDNASEGLDNFDAYKLNPLDLKNYLSLATIAGGNALDINNLPLSLTQQVSIPVQINAFEATGNAWKSLGGQVNLSWSQIESLPSGWSIVLVDELNGDRINMREQTNYGFALEAVVSKAVAYEANMAPKTVAATSNSRFRIEIGPMTTSVKELETLPNSISLNQNYPNPFNPSTQISFNLPSSMNVNLAVFDMLGREVVTLLNGKAKAGLNYISYNASNLSSGIYFYRLIAGNEVATKKMILIK